MEVGVRELKAKLSEYLGRAAAGESIVVTDRGTPIAQLVGLDDGSAVARGIDEGWIEPARRTKLAAAPKRHVAAMSVLDALDDDRGD